MWVENGCPHERRRAVRYAIFVVYHVSNGTFRAIVVAFFYPHFVPNGTLTLSVETNHYMFFIFHVPLTFQREKETWKKPRLLFL